MIAKMVFLWLFAMGNAGAVQPLKVVASFSILADLISQIGQNNVHVQTIVPCNADPHTYEPTPNDAIACAKADLIFINGLTFEGWIDRLIEASGYKGRVVEASLGITPRSLKSQGDPTIDPHAWHNVQNVVSYVKVITAALCEALPPTSCQSIQERGALLVKKLENVHQWVHREFEKIPKDKRLVVTTHDAFWYYGDAYGITFLSPVGISTEAQPSAKAISTLINSIRTQNIKAIFIENLTNPKLVEQIAREANVDVDGVLFADSLSEQGGPASSYINMIQHNTTQIMAALTH